MRKSSCINKIKSWYLDYLHPYSKIISLCLISIIFISLLIIINREVNIISWIGLLISVLAIFLNNTPPKSKVVYRVSKQLIEATGGVYYKKGTVSPVTCISFANASNSTSILKVDSVYVNKAKIEKRYFDRLIRVSIDNITDFYLKNSTEMRYQTNIEFEEIKKKYLKREPNENDMFILIFKDIAHRIKPIKIKIPLEEIN